MAKFNKRGEREFVENFMGGKAFVANDKEQLAFAVLSTFLENTYYESAKARIDRIVDLAAKVAKKDPLFILKLAIYARNNYYLRSVSHLLVNTATKHLSGDPVVRRAINQLVVRGDDVTEIAATYLLNGEKLPGQVKKGLADAIQKFDAYQLAKSRGDDNKVSMVDIFNLVHPTPVDEAQAALWKSLIDGELKQGQGATATWEALLSSGMEKGAAFEQLLSQRKLPYMATLRNVRNIWESGNQNAIKMAADYIRNPVAVANSKQFPFRWLSAYAALYEAYQRESYSRIISFRSKDEGLNLLLEAIESAMLTSVGNLPVLEDDTVILIDNSGSMRGDFGGSSTFSKYSQRTSADAANLLGLLYWMRTTSVWLGLFGDNLLQPDLDRSKGIFENFRLLDKKADQVGGGTEAGIFVAFRDMIKNNTNVARVVVFSDDQIGDRCGWYGYGEFRGDHFYDLQNKFHAKFPETKIYSVNIKGYAPTVFNNNVIKVAGFSDKIFTLMNAFEKYDGNMVKEIEATQI